MVSFVIAVFLNAGFDQPDIKTVIFISCNHFTALISSNGWAWKNFKKTKIRSIF